uniref:Uncharacterized protein n=1 Tax=Echinococcus canadensis TaxID=519352 RepID=A0A915EXT4_9CEST
MEDFKVNHGFICCLICSKWVTSVIFSSHCSILMGTNKSKLLLFVLRHSGQIDLPLGKSTWQPQDDLTECKNPKTCNSLSCSQPSTRNYQYCLRQLLTRSYVATSLNNSRSPLKNEHLYHPNY